MCYFFRAGKYQTKTNLILFPNKLTGVIRLGSWNTLTLLSRPIALTVFVTSFALNTLVDKLSKLSVDEDL